MPQSPCMLDDLRIQRGAPYADPPVLTATRDGTVVWTTQLQVADRGDLMPRIERPQVVAGHVLAKTDGEHTRGATSHDPRVHLIDSTGKVLWWKPWRVEAPVLSDQGDLMLLVMRERYHRTEDTPAAWALRVRVRDGRPLHAWPMQFPTQTSEALRKTSWPSLHADLYHKGSGFYALLKARWRGGEDQLKIRLDESGYRPRADERFESS